LFVKPAAGVIKQGSAKIGITEGILKFTLLKDMQTCMVFIAERRLLLRKGLLKAQST